MPGWELNPNIDASENMAFGYQFTGDREQTIGQFPTDVEDEKVQNFFVIGESTNISFRFELPQFPESG